MENTMEMKELFEYINNSGNETTRTYENRMTDAISKEDLNKKDNNKEENNIIHDRLKMIYTVLEDPSQDENIRYACFVMATIYNRRNKNKSKFKQLLDTYTEFSNHESYNHYYLLYYVDHGYDEEWLSILQRAEQNANTMHNAGPRHMFAEFVAMFFEDRRCKPTIEQKEHFLSEAIKNVNMALYEQDYAKFYATRGRLLALQGQYEEAIDNINYAIDKEDSKRKDYAIRIGNYQVARIRIQESRNLKAIEQQMKQYQVEQEIAFNDSIAKQYDIYNKVLDESKEISGSLTRNLEYLGIFAGIISFTMGSISLAGSMNTTAAAAGLIIVLFGALSGTYYIFDIIIHGLDKKKKIQYILTALIVLLILIGGLYLCLRA